MNTADLIRVTQLVRRFLPPGVDYENVAMDVVLESWTKGHDIPSRGFVKNRCWDALRKRRTELKANEGLFIRSPDETQGDLEGVDFDNLMTKLVHGLSVDERKVIWYRFYLGSSVAEIAKKMDIGKGKVYIMLAESLFKMRQEIIDG